MSPLLSPDVLLVEDHAPTAAILGRLLKSIGATVRLSGTVADGVSALSHEPCLIVLDLMLPDGNGVEVLQAVRNAHLRSKVAVVSAINQQNLLQQVTALNPDAIFSKPLDFDDFVDWFNSIAPDLPEIGFKS